MKTTVNIFELPDAGSTFSPSDFPCAVNFNSWLRLSHKCFYIIVLKNHGIYSCFMFQWASGF